MLHFNKKIIQFSTGLNLLGYVMREGQNPRPLFNSYISNFEEISVFGKQSNPTHNDNDRNFSSNWGGDRGKLDIIEQQGRCPITAPLITNTTNRGEGFGINATLSFLLLGIIKNSIATTNN